MDDQQDQGILDQFLKRRPGALPAFPVLAGCLLLMIWIAFGMRMLAIWTSDPAYPRGQFFTFIADPLAALAGSVALTYLIKSSSTLGGKLLGLAAIPIGLFFGSVLSGGEQPITPLLIFQMLFTFLMGWFGGSLASGQFAARLKYRGGMFNTANLPVNRFSARYRRLLARVGGNEATARRLIAHERSVHPQHNGEQLIQDALDNLSRDRSKS
jgi:hypothetical protein